MSNPKALLASHSHQTLAQALFAPLVLPRLAQQAILVGFGLLLLTLSAKIKIHLGPVPFTMQTLVVLLLATAYGARMGVVSVALYVFGGMLTGLPVFSSASFAVTAGYLVGFVVAAALVGSLAERGWDRSMPKTFAMMILGNLVIYAFGVFYLVQAGAALEPLLDNIAHIFGNHAHASALPALGLQTALQVGMFKFLIVDLAKIAVAMLLLPSAWALIGRLNSK